jgi:four helix bundle protein
MSLQALSRLQVWVRAKDFALKVYARVLPGLPAEEKWNLGQQLRRSALSISANIAEGHGRFYYQDNIRFCYNARGSLRETLSHLVFAQEAGYIKAPLFEELRIEGEEIEKMLDGYIAHIRRTKQGAADTVANRGLRELKEPYLADADGNIADPDHLIF